MTLEDQCCSLELAKRLKELGVKQESLFYWQKYGAGNYLIWNNQRDRPPQPHLSFSAFTVAELGEMLLPYWKQWKDFPPTWLGLDENNEAFCRGIFSADEWAKFAIHLIEKGIIKP